MKMFLFDGNNILKQIVSCSIITFYCACVLSGIRTLKSLFSFLLDMFEISTWKYPGECNFTNCELNLLLGLMT